MNKIDVFDIFFNGFSYTWKHNMILGIMFLLFGVLIVIVPQLLVVMVASFFMLGGVLMIAAGWMMRRFHQQYHSFRDELFEIF